MAVGVVAELDLSAMGIDALAHLPAAVVLIAGDMARSIGIADQLAAGVAQIMLDMPVGLSVCSRRPWLSC